MKSLVVFELKKILQKKILWITFIIFLLFQFSLTSLSYFISSRYVDGKFLETKADWYKTERKNAGNLSGRKIDDKLLAEIEESKKHIPASREETGSYEYLSSDNYKNNVRPYEGINRLVQYMLGGNAEMAEGAGYTSITQKILYSARRKVVEERWEAFKLTDAEKEYWQKEEEKLPEVFTYKYGGAFEKLTDMDGCYFICMFVTFFIAICITGIFTDEHLRKTDQIVLCTKNGRKQSFIAKMAAGCIVTTCVALILWLVTIICFIGIVGPGEFSAMVQVTSDPVYPGNLSIGQAALIMTALLFISSIALSITTMALSELLNNSIGTMAIIIAIGFFLARLIYIPADFKFIAKVWNMIPINILKSDQGFFDVRLWNVFGIKLTLWQMAFIAYIVIGVAFFFIGRRKYCKYQISGR